MRAFKRSTGLLLVAAFLWSCATSQVPTPPRAVAGGVQFTLSAPGANSASLVGSFNGWSLRAHPMRADGDGRWTLVVPLPPGEYQFMYVIDGKQWLTPPLAEDYLDDGFGQKNGVLSVR